jgi:DNA modification methylase
VHFNDYDDFGSEIEMLEQGFKLVVKLVYKCYNSCNNNKKKFIKTKLIYKGGLPRKSYTNTPIFFKNLFASRSTLEEHTC